ncbi:MAG TPA: HD domain-containing phosphohydrolase [Blastocatellia bacterium]|nr:HD domain-containing phosphohydrolase [Blastocatellia bacterium]
METAKGKTREEIINRLADRIDSFERYSQPHSRLMAELATHLSRRLGLTEFDTSAVAEAALLHDIGLYAMSPAYCHSPEALNFQERLDLWRHPVIGEQQMAKREASRHAQLLVRWHHEWWNGSGYPDSLAFEDIPIGARILRAVELYSAITSDRPYRAALDEEAALDALKSSAGIECDPHVVKALVALLDELRAEHEAAAPEIYAPSIPGGEQLAESGDATQDILGVLEEQPTNASAPQDPWTVGGEDQAGDRLASLEPLSLSEAPIALSVAPIEQSPLAPSTAERTSAAPRRVVPTLELLLSRTKSDHSSTYKREGYGWRSSRYNPKLLLGFEASVLSQIEFRSIAIPFSGAAKLALYLKTWGKLILANDPRAWAAAAAHALVQAREPIGEEHISRVLQDVYVPGARLNNPALRQWFGETDAWWMDNLRRNIQSLDNESLGAQALAIGMLTGDYALSFDDETRDLRMPLTTVFWRLAGRAITGPATNPRNQSFNLPAEEFIRQARTDLIYLNLPPGQSEKAGAEARSEWREAWVSGTNAGDANEPNPLATVQSRQSYLTTIDRLLRFASQVKTWALECQETGLSSAQDLVELVKEYRPVRATYSKDLTEVVGGLRSCIIVADRPAKSR